MLAEPVYQEILLEKESGKGFVAADVLQTLFLISTQVMLFPAVALIDIYKTYIHWKEYKKEKNNHFSKKTFFAIRILTTTAEVTAAGVLVAGYFGIQLFATGIISTIFFGCVTVKCLSHFTQMLYHGVKWAFSESGTKKNQTHKTECKTHLKGTIVLGAISAGIGLTLVAPVFHLFTVSMAMIMTVKAVGAAIVSLYAIQTTHSIYKIQQQKKQQNKEWEEKYYQAKMIRENARNRLQDLNKQPKDLNTIFLMKRFDALANTPGPLEKEDKTRAYFGPHHTLRHHYKNNHQDLQKEDIGDLVRSLEASDEVNGPKDMILKQLRKMIDTLLNNLGVKIEIDSKTPLELDKDGLLPTLKSHHFSLITYIQTTELRDRLHAVLVLEALIKNDKNALVIHEKNKTWPIDTVYDLTYYIEAKGRTANVFQSFFRDPKIKELFGLVDYYLEHKDLHPETREPYEKNRKYQITPVSQPRLATLC